MNWALDADIRRFFDSVNHEWLPRMLAHRVADPRILGLIRGWLRAGVLDGKVWSETVEGTPQGAGISPLLANVFLHYVLDRWVHQWRKRHAHGRVIIVRDADDFVMGFQYEADPRKMLADLHERFATFSLVLHEDKTRLIEFGRLSTERRQARGDRPPETFAFLGFTPYCARSRAGPFVVKRRTDRRRLTRKLHTVRTEQRRRTHAPLPAQHRWLCRVLRGHYRYYGLPSNWHALDGFYDEVRRGWFRALRRRSQRGLTWDRFTQWLARLPLPGARILHTRKALAG